MGAWMECGEGAAGRIAVARVVVVNGVCRETNENKKRRLGMRRVAIGGKGRVGGVAAEDDGGTRGRGGVR